MHPILIHIGHFPIHTFGVLMGSGFLAGILYSLRQSRKWGLDPEVIFNLSFWIMVSGVLGARALYVFIDIGQKGWSSEFVTWNVTKWVALWEGGLVWYGGFIAASIVVIAYAYRQKLPVWRVADVLAPAAFMGLAIGRIGCLMAGDDFGKPTHVPWAVTFHNPLALVYPPSLLGVPLHPTQTYMQMKSFTVAFVCHMFLKRWKRYDGAVLALSMMVYSVLRFIIEYFRADTERGFIPGTGQWVSTSQGIGIAVFILGIVLLLWRKRAAPAISASPATVAPPPPQPPPDAATASA